MVCACSTSLRVFAQLLPCTLNHEGRHLAWLDPAAQQAVPVRRPHPAPPGRPTRRLILPKPDTLLLLCISALCRNEFNCRVRACENAQLESQSELHLPLWLAEPLSRRQHVELQLPRFYGTSYRNALRADAAHLNLREQTPFYFDVGVELSRLLGDSELGSQLLGAFASRFHELIGPSLNVTSRLDSTAIVEKLTGRETTIFDAGRDASEKYTKWKADKTRGRIEQSNLVTQQAKRRRVTPLTREPAT